MLEKILAQLNPARDTDHFDSAKYRQLLAVEAEDLDNGTPYLFSTVLGKIPKHLIRGACITGLPLIQIIIS